MSTKTIIAIVVFAAAFGVYVIWQSVDNSIKGKQEEISGFVPLTSAELAIMLSSKDFILVDVHTPEQRHIPKTDYFIPYQEIEKLADVTDKNDKIVLYCRSGSMSKIAAAELSGMGYTNIFDLTNGLNGWLDEERETTEQGGVKSI